MFSLCMYKCIHACMYVHKRAQQAHAVNKLLNFNEIMYACTHYVCTYIQTLNKLRQHVK